MVQITKVISASTWALMHQSKFCFLSLKLQERQRPWDMGCLDLILQMIIIIIVSLHSSHLNKITWTGEETLVDEKVEPWYIILHTAQQFKGYCSESTFQDCKHSLEWFFPSCFGSLKFYQVSEGHRTGWSENSRFNHDNPKLQFADDFRFHSWECCACKINIYFFVCLPDRLRCIACSSAILHKNFPSFVDAKKCFRVERGAAFINKQVFRTPSRTY